MESIKKIIRAHHKGLGDSLQLSTLPSLFHAIGDEVWISDKTPCNDQIYDLVWKHNPFVKGKTSEPANCGEIPGLEYDNPCGSFIKNWEKINGLEPENDFPIIYYHPKEIPELKELTLLDISCSSRKNDYDENVLNDYLSLYRYNSDSVSLSIRFIYFQDINNKYGFPEINCESIFHYCDMIYSCKKFVCLNSGGNSLASALKRFKDIDVDCLVTHTPTFESMYERKNFFYPNINYVWL